MIKIRNWVGHYFLHKLLTLLMVLLVTGWVWSGSSFIIFSEDELLSVDKQFSFPTIDKMEKVIKDV